MQFEARDWQIKNGIGKYCSQKCSNEGSVGRKLTKKQRLKIGLAIKNSPVFRKSIRRGRENPCFKEVIYNDGYRYISDKEGNKVAEHRLVAEKKIGRPLKAWEVVHHIDKDKLNNSPDNLEVLSRAEHILTHREDLDAGITRSQR